MKDGKRSWQVGQEVQENKQSKNLKRKHTYRQEKGQWEITGQDLKKSSKELQEDDRRRHRRPHPRVLLE